MNFLIIFIVIFMLGVVIGILAFPLKRQQKSGILASMPVQWATTLVASETTEPPVRATGNITPPRLIQKVDPVYPEAARQARIEGTVILEATTDVYGRVKNTKVLKSVPPLDQAAIDAVTQWVYEPIIIDGNPRGVIFTVTVAFNLK